ncbi:hypothetical protein D915_004352 [Fasciola hepatica]|uniref:Tetraspanin n=1 Tax=Fasciola hepatica TaxID=6192 RepID=A0A4E0RC25_FASHE|nr:hypothetical protein D915_004352 [Fasciola hepatica]
MRGEKSAVMCSKTLLIAFNLFFVLVGLLFVGISCWALITPNTFFGITNLKIVHICGWCFLLLGGVLIFIAFLGCTGAALENRCLLTTFFTILCGIFMGCLVSGVLIAVFKDELATLAVNRLSIGIQQDYGTSAAWTEWIDALQTKMRCCAVDSHGATLYTRSIWYFQQREQPPHQVVQFSTIRSPTDLVWPEEVEPTRLANVPPSCCRRDEDGQDYVNLTACQFGQLDPTGNVYINAQGCANAVATVIRTYAVPILASLISVVIILISGLILSLILLRGAIPEDYDAVATV